MSQTKLEEMKMSKKTLSASTPHGTFQRSTSTAYTHIVVVSPRTYWSGGRVTVSGPEEFMARSGDSKRGVWGRIAKDRGYVVSWHGSEEAARRVAASGKNNAYCAGEVLGVFPVG